MVNPEWHNYAWYDYIGYHCVGILCKNQQLLSTEFQNIPTPYLSDMEPTPKLHLNQTLLISIEYLSLQGMNLPFVLIVLLWYILLLIYPIIKNHFIFADIKSMVSLWHQLLFKIIHFLLLMCICIYTIPIHSTFVHIVIPIKSH